MTCKTIIILGAGATAGEGAIPTQKGLMKRIFEEFIVKNGETELVSDWRLEDFFRDFYGITTRNFTESTFPSFEECFGVLDWAGGRETELFKFKPLELEIVRECITNLMLILLQNESEYPNSKHPSHTELVRKIITKNEINATTFISLNYDLNIDHVLEAFKVPIDYGVQFYNYRRPKKKDIALLIKLHGSLKWVYCPVDEIHLIINNEFRNSSQIIPTCPKCGNRLQLHIIPPTFHKIEIMNDTFTNNLFKTALASFKTAEKVYFCGYSLPEADIDFRYLIKMVESLRGGFPETYLMNEKMNDEDFQRIIRNFRIKTDIHRTNYSFADFVNNF